AGRARRIAYALGAQAAVPEGAEPGSRAEAGGERVDERADGVVERRLLVRLRDARDEILEVVPVADRDRVDDGLGVREEPIEGPDLDIRDPGDPGRRQRPRSLPRQNLVGGIEDALQLVVAHASRIISRERVARARLAAAPPGVEPVPALLRGAVREGVGVHAPGGLALQAVVADRGGGVEGLLDEKVIGFIAVKSDTGGLFLLFVDPLARGRAWPDTVRSRARCAAHSRALGVVSVHRGAQHP